MTSLFDGMAGLLSDVFGAPVVLTPPGGDAFTVQALFREAPTEVVGEDGRGVWIEAPTVKVRRDLVAGIERLWHVAPSTAPGRDFRVLSVHPSGSPAADAFLIAVLEEVTA